MPVQPPAFDIPTFPPTGNAEIDGALTAWQQSFSQQYRAGQEAVSRTPYVVSTFKETTPQVTGGAYVAKHVTLLGGEQVQVWGVFDFEVSAANAIGTLRVTYPSGSTARFGAQPARLGVTGTVQGLGGTTANPTPNSTVSVTIRGTVGFLWAIEPRFQTGGDHTFTLMTSGSGEISAATLSVLVL